MPSSNNFYEKEKMFSFSQIMSVIQFDMLIT
jgi:hypothetical protein